MLIQIVAPRVIAEMTTARIEAVYCRPGAEFAVGAKLFDVSVDLGAAFRQNCPPVSYYRIIARERAWLRELRVQPGDAREPGFVLALTSTEPDEPLDGGAARTLRINTVGILWNAAMWSAATAP